MSYLRYGPVIETDQEGHESSDQMRRFIKLQEVEAFNIWGVMGVMGVIDLLECFEFSDLLQNHGNYS